MLLLLATAAPAFAASSTEFYMTLLRRGAADVDAGRNAAATTNLRLAAFGLLESIEHYQTAQAYLAVAFDRLGQTDQAREAAQRIVTAEKVERKFRSIALPATIRTAFDNVAKKVLSAADAAALSGGATAKPGDPVIVNRVDVVTEKPATTQPPAPKPAQPQTTQPPAAKPAQPQVAQPQTQPQTQPQARTQPQPQPQQPQNTPTQRSQTPPPQTTQPPRTTTPPPAQPRTVDVSGQFAAAERALVSANIAEARRIYRELLAVQGLERGALIRLAEGFYRSRDFANALAAFDRAGNLRSGEEPYRYYVAVAAYEVGQYDRARRELAAALPYIELTPDVQRYRVKIEGTR